MTLPAVRIVWAGAAAEVCVQCARPWPMLDGPVPAAYTEASIQSADPPAPVCDLCIEEHDPVMFEELLAERRRFHAG